MSFRKPTLIAAMAALLLMAPAAGALVGEPGPMPPGDLQGDYDDETRTVTLTWIAPPGGATYEYHVYRDGEPLATTSDTSYTDQLAAQPLTDQAHAFYFVTASVDGQESLPSAPLFVGDAPTCEPVIFFVNESKIPPGISWGVNDACIEMWERTIENNIGRLIDELPVNVDLPEPN